jgi:hypothetical protein
MAARGKVARKERSTMSRTRHKPAIPPLRERRGGTFVVGVAAIAAAWVLTACDPVSIEPLLMAVIPGASAGENPPAGRSTDPVRAAATSDGEISAIEPIKQSDTAKNDKPIGYRIHIRLDGGSSRSVERDQLNGLDVGARVRIEGGQLKQL